MLPNQLALRETGAGGAFFDPGGEFLWKTNGNCLTHMAEV